MPNCLLLAASLSSIFTFLQVSWLGSELREKRFFEVFSLTSSLLSPLS
jgi:hypothetical protein